MLHGSDESMLVPVLLYLPGGTIRQMEAPFGMPDLTSTLLNAGDYLWLIGSSESDLPTACSAKSIRLLKLHSLGYARGLPITVMRPGGKEYHAVHTSRYTFMCLSRKALVAG